MRYYGNRWREQEDIVLKAPDGEFVGVIVLMPFWGSIIIAQIFVEQVHRGKGIGSRLLRLAIERSREQGARFITAETASYEALDFYVKNGFTLEFTRSGFDDGVEGHYLRLDL